jgi:putative membrane protein
VDERQRPPQHISDHLANERTILAWIRTSIAVITFGVAINRFSLFLLELHQVVPQMQASSNRHAETVGIGLVILGLAIMCGAIWHYLHVANTIDSQTYRPPRMVMAVTSLAVVVIGGAALIWLF